MHVIYLGDVYRRITASVMPRESSHEREGERKGKNEGKER